MQSAQDSDTSRLETFADGVMAIAITLLILDVHIPHVRPGDSLLHALAHQWPSYAGYVVSFLTIGIMWVNHHHMFKLIERSNHTFLMLNVVFLMAIAAVPWPTALVASAAHDAHQRTVAAVVYGVVMVFVAIMFNVVWRYAARDGRLLVANVDLQAVERINRSYLFGPAAYVTATLVALANSWASLALYAGLAVYWMLPGTSRPSATLLVQPPSSASQPDGPSVVPDETQ